MSAFLTVLVNASNFLEHLIPDPNYNILFDSWDAIRGSTYFDGFDRNEIKHTAASLQFR